MKLDLRWFAALVLGFGVGTMLLGWWTVPAIGFGVRWGVRSPKVPLFAIPLAAGLAWGLLLLRASLAPGFASYVPRVEGVVGVPAIGLYLVTILFPTLAALGAALVAQALRPTET